MPLGRLLLSQTTRRIRARLIGPVSGLAKVCTEYLDAATPAVPGQRPSANDAAADQQWLRGCEAGYYQDHPHQVVEFGMMYAPGTQPCTGVCPSNWYAAGKTVALAASPYLSPSSADTAGSAATWCADLLFPEPGQSMPASTEAVITGEHSRIRAGNCRMVKRVRSRL